ncbi:MAG: hypothetical protein PHG41_07460 [Actinomycetota bacterium]|nr:hypothetical protein [Actinomycetota bacterium]
MKTINLLPKEEKITDVKSIVLNIVLVVVVIILVFMIGFAAILFKVNDYLTPQLYNYQRANTRINNYITRLEAYEQFKEKVDNNKKVIDYLQKEKVLWSDVLYDFGQEMPKNTYITYIDGDVGEYYNLVYGKGNIDPDKVDKVRFFNITGYALEHTDISKLVVHILNMDNVGDVLINNISKDYVTDSKIEVLSFNISVYMDVEEFLDEIREKQKQTEEIEKEELEQELGM